MNSFALKMNTEVFGLDKACGRLAQIAMDPATWHVTDLVVEAGFLFKRARVIPIRRLLGTLGGGIYLSFHDEEMSDYPEFQEVAVEKRVPQRPPTYLNHDARVPDPTYTMTPAPEQVIVKEMVRIGVAQDLLLLDSRTQVNGLDGKIGHLSHILITEDFLITHLVVAQGPPLLQQNLIPVSLVQMVSEPLIRTAATPHEISEFAEFSPVEG